jgi:DNA-binding transcriptional LysR family regulator
MHDLDDEPPATHGLDFRLLNQFLTICEAPNMAAAARKMSLSPPAVSQIIRRIERELGISAFERSSRGIRLTPAGILLRQQARRLVEAESEMIEALVPYRNQLLPKLRVQISSTVANYVSPAIVGALSKYVGEIQLKSGRVNQGAHDFLRGEFDILISSDELSQISNLDRFLLCRESLIALTPPNVGNEELSLPWVAAHLPLIRFEQGSQIEQVVETYLKRHGVNLPRTIECRTPAPIIELVAQGLGWAITTPLGVGYYHPLDKTAYMPLPEPNPPREVHLIANSGRLLDFPATLAGVCRAALARTVRSWKSTANRALTSAVAVETAEVADLDKRRA